MEQELELSAVVGFQGKSPHPLGHLANWNIIAAAQVLRFSET